MVDGLFLGFVFFIRGYFGLYCDRDVDGDEDGDGGMVSIEMYR
jgi:hypothetical protein